MLPHEQQQSIKVANNQKSPLNKQNIKTSLKHESSPPPPLSLTKAPSKYLNFLYLCVLFIVSLIKMEIRIISLLLLLLVFQTCLNIELLFFLSLFEHFLKSVIL